MHEMSLCEGLLDILQQQAHAQDYLIVKTIFLEIGKLSNVEPDAIRFAFPVVAKHTLAENAKLEIKEIDGLGYCSNCQQTVMVEHRFDCCSLCGKYQLQIVSGEQMRIVELEVSNVFPNSKHRE